MPIPCVLFSLSLEVYEMVSRNIAFPCVGSCLLVEPLGLEGSDEQPDSHLITVCAGSFDHIKGPPGLSLIAGGNTDAPGFRPVVKQTH